MTVPSPTVNASDNMLSAFSPCRYAPCQVAAVVVQPFVVYSAVHSAGGEQLQ